MQFLAENMKGRELRRWIVRRSNLLQSFATQTKGVGQASNMEEQRKELAFMCRHAMSMQRSKGLLPNPDDPTFSSALEILVSATIVARQLNLFGLAVRRCPSKLSRAMWRKVGEEFNDDDVLHGGYKDR